MYSIGNTYGHESNNSICATGYHEEYITEQDIDLFKEWFNPEWEQCGVDVIGPNDQTQPGGEATMDVQLIMGVAPNVPAVFWSTGGAEIHGPNANEPFLAFMSALLGAQSPPLVVTTSYGDDELDLDVDYINQANSQFQLAGLRGISILFASGDGGVAGGHGIPGCTQFVAVFPSACPFVTAVGGTQLNVTSSVESGIDFSSGGFSNYWSAPSYQAAAVQYYLGSSGATMPNSKLYNISGRAFVSEMSYDMLLQMSPCLHR
jgi:tripeptidyl-peptidase-1